MTNFSEIEQRNPKLFSLLTQEEEGYDWTYKCFLLTNAENHILLTKTMFEDEEKWVIPCVSSYDFDPELEIDPDGQLSFLRSIDLKRLEFAGECENPELMGDEDLPIVMTNNLFHLFHYKVRDAELDGGKYKFVDFAEIEANQSDYLIDTEGLSMLSIQPDLLYLMSESLRR